VKAGNAFRVDADIESLLGRRYTLSDHYEVGREKIREFARAVHNVHPAHYESAAARESTGFDELIAPMTFTAILGGEAQRCVFEQFLPQYDLSQVLHTEQRIVQHRPVRAGDALSCRVTLDSFRSVHGQDVFTLKTEITDRTNVLLQTGWTTAVARAGGVIDDDIARAVDGVLMHRPVEVGPRARVSPLRLLDDDIPIRVGTDGPPPRGRQHARHLRVGDALPPVTMCISRGDLVNYSGVAGDPNPVHWSDSIVSMAGLDNVIAHGMFTMGLGAGYLAECMDDPCALVEFAVRFARPVYVESRTAADIAFTGTVKKIDPTNNTADIALTAVAKGGRIFGRATGTVRLN
jgi:acyl dehydratase